jgi:hypothetical protein
MFDYVIFRILLMRRKLSSYDTFLIKFVLPAFWMLFFTFMPVGMFTRAIDEPNGWIFLLAWIAGTAYFLWDANRLKTVSVDDKFLYASNYLKEIAIPLSDIYDVTENFWLNTHPVTIHLKSPSEFGNKIVFLPKRRVFALFSSHPVVAELKQLAKSTTAHNRDVSIR